MPPGRNYFFSFSLGLHNLITIIRIDYLIIYRFDFIIRDISLSSVLRYFFLLLDKEKAPGLNPGAAKPLQCLKKSYLCLHLCYLLLKLLDGGCLLALNVAGAKELEGVGGEGVIETPGFCLIGIAH